MARHTTKKSNAIVGVQNATSAFTTAQYSLNLYNIVQDWNYSIALPRQNLKQVGTQDVAAREFFNQPDVEVGFAYIPEPSLANESNGRFLGPALPTSTFVNMFSGALEMSTNFYVFVSPNEQDDVLLSIQAGAPTNLSGFNVIAFGNCFPTTYSLSYSIGTLPIVSTNYVCSNAVFENATGTSMQLPAINLESGNDNEVGISVFNFGAGVGIKDGQSAIIVNPTDAGSSISLENLQVGGQPLSGLHLVQSLNMNVNLPRVSNYGLGNDFAYGRQAQLPAKGTFEVSSLVSGLDSGVLTGVLNNDSTYNFELVLEASGKKMIYQIEDAKLNSYNYGMSVSQNMTFDASFSFNVTETHGLKLSGTAY
tara:strand:- start:20 stop:1114 length:1095 start_codon:yes stop_codon:yes gene_type:complete